MSASTIALIECAMTCDAALPDRLRRLGNFVVTFEGAANFMAAARQGAGFDLLLSPVLQPARWHELLHLCARMGIPVILRPDEQQMPMLVQALVSAKERFSSRVDVNFATLPITDIELGCWVGLLSRPWPSDLRHRERQTDRSYGAYKLNVARRKAFVHELDAKLTPREFDLARFLFENVDRPIGRDVLLKAVWGLKAGLHRSRAPDVCISNLRRKMNFCEGNGFELLRTYAGGYELRRNPHAATEFTLAESALASGGSAIEQGCELA